MLDAIVENSRYMTKQGSKSFAVAARLLPVAVRNDSYMLYSWCRHCDDVIDGQYLGFALGTEPVMAASERLKSLRQKTERALRGDADEPVFIALHRVVKAHDIPDRHPLELLDGFGMDVDARSYDTLNDVLDYSYHVAGVVGVMMAMVMGARKRDTLNRASDLGIAFQLTNISRDVMDDAKTGRVYLPGDWLREAGVPETGIDDPAHRAAVATVTQRLLTTAEDYYASAKFGLVKLPYRSALAVATARQVYREIGLVVKKRGASAWDSRTIISRRRKAACVAAAVLAASNAHSFGRLQTETSRDGLWTPPALGVA